MNKKLLVLLSLLLITAITVHAKKKGGCCGSSAKPAQSTKAAAMQHPEQTEPASIEPAPQITQVMDPAEEEITKARMMVPHHKAVFDGIMASAERAEQIIQAYHDLGSVNEILSDPN